jgi:soluble lytic murein transglycosylase-like protein
VATFRDAQGTLHITTAPAKLKDDLIRLAGYEWPAHLPRSPATPGDEAGSTQVAESRPVPAPLAKRAAAIAAAAPPTTPGARTLRRFKDSKGVLHIVSRPTPPALPVAEAPLPARPPALPAANFLGTPRSLPAPALKDARGAPVAVRRDRDGKVKIISQPQPLPLARGPSPPPEALRPLTVEAARANDLPVSLVEAVIRVESNFTPHAVSPKGAMGLMQLMPGTARDLGVEDPFCPRQNIHAGSRYLRLLLNLFGQDLPLALAAYNAGFRRVLEHGGRVPPIPETQDFVSRVLQEYTQREQHLARFRDGPG